VPVTVRFKLYYLRNYNRHASGSTLRWLQLEVDRDHKLTMGDSTDRKHPMQLSDNTNNPRPKRRKYGSEFEQRENLVQLLKQFEKKLQSRRS
jgi:hypothetical protein